jgi:hypothetical protein
MLRHTNRPLADYFYNLPATMRCHDRESRAPRENQATMARVQPRSLTTRCLPMLVQWAPRPAGWRNSPRRAG